MHYPHSFGTAANMAVKNYSHAMLLEGYAEDEVELLARGFYSGFRTSLNALNKVRKIEKDDLKQIKHHIKMNCVGDE